MNNKATYGNDIGSFAMKFYINDTLAPDKVILDNVASGQVYPYTFTISLVDYDGQMMNYETSNIQIIPSNSSSTNLNTVFESVVAA